MDVASSDPEVHSSASKPNPRVCKQAAENNWLGFVSDRKGGGNAENWRRRELDWCKRVEDVLGKVTCFME